MNQEPRPAISVVVPVYNEEECATLLHQKVREACEGLGRSYEVIFIDDGSTDRTAEILGAAARRDPPVRLIRFRKNYGQTAAMAAGFAQARGEYIVSMDGDLQNDPADIPKLLAKMDEGYDLVCGWRKRRQDKLLTRRIPSMVANWLIGKVTGVKISDNGCSLKAYRASVIKSVELYGEMHRFIPAMTTLAGARITEIVVNHHPRRFGQSKYGLARVWKVALDIVLIKMIVGFSSRPALWFGLLGLPFLVVGTTTLIVAAALFLGQVTEGWIVLSTAAFLILFLGAHLLSLGVIGELAVHTGDFSPKTMVRPTVGTLD